MAEKKKLTSLFVERVKPPLAGRVEYADTVLRGFALRVTENGRKSWSYMYRFNGRLRRLTLGRYPTVDLAGAREKVRNAQQMIDRNEDPAEANQQRKELQKNLFGDVVKEFIERYAKPNTRTWESTERLFELHTSKWDQRSIVTIKRADIIQLIDDLTDNKTSYVARHVFAALRKFFNWAAERGIVDASPCAYISPPGKVVSRERVLTEDEIKRVWAACNKLAFPFGHLIKMLLLTGQRKDEVTKMRWQDIDLPNKVWTIPREIVKADRAHEVPLSDLALQLLENMPRFNGEYIFTTTGGLKAVSGHSKAKSRVDIMSEVSKWRLHDLRRTAATNMAKLGVPVPTISRVLNHAQGGVTSIYNRHSYLPEKTEALEKWAKRLEELNSIVLS